MPITSFCFSTSIIRFSRRFLLGPLPWNFQLSWRKACFCVILRPYSS